MHDNEMVKSAVMHLSETYKNAVPIFGGAPLAYAEIHQEVPNFDGFIRYLAHVIDEAKFRKWHDGVAGALKTFCHLCLVDPALIEAYLGRRFEQIEQDLR